MAEIYCVATDAELLTKTNDGAGGVYSGRDIDEEAQKEERIGVRDSASKEVRMLADALQGNCGGILIGHDIQTGRKDYV